MPDTSVHPGRPEPGSPPSVAAMLLGQVHYANRGFWRTPIAAFFTLVFPLSFLVILSAIYGNEVVDPATGLRLAQYTTPAFAVFGACMACYVSLAIALAYARDAGVLKRLLGTPLPPGVQVAGRVVSAIWLAGLAVGLMVSVGVAFYGVEIIAVNVPALLLAFLVGTACWAALGLAVAAVARTPNAANTFANASLILLAFISGVFAVGAQQEWMDRVASVFPLEPFVDSFADGFNPYVDASMPDWGNLALMAAWGIVGGIITWRALRWEPNAAGAGVRRGRRARPIAEELPDDVGGGPATVREVADANVLVEIAAGAPAAVPATPAGRLTAGAQPDGMAAATASGSGGWAPMVGQQTRYAVVQMLRDPMSLFFAVVFPILLLAFFSVVYSSDVQWGGLPLPQYLAAAFAVYGAGVTAFVNLPGTLAEQRTRGVLKRLRGTPMPPLAYLMGRVLAALLLGLLTIVLVFVVGVTLFSVTLPPSTWLATLLTFVLSICCFAACGLAIVAVIDGPQAVIAVTLSILLPLSFISDIFINVDQLPTVLDAIAWTLPLRHAVAAAVAATSGAALDASFWGHLGVVALWTAGSLLVALRWFHWDPRRSAAG